MGSIEALTWSPTKAIAPSPITRQASITLAHASAWDNSLQALPLYGDPESPSVVTFEHGRGRVYWWASATPLTNAGFAGAGNLEFCSRRSVPRTDDACCGTNTSTAIATRSPVDGRIRRSSGCCVQFALVAGDRALDDARRSGPIVMPRTEHRLSPLEFVRTLGSLYGRAGAASIALDATYQRFRRLG